MLVIVAVCNTHIALAQLASQPSEASEHQDVAKLDEELRVVATSIQHEVGDPIAQDPSQCGALPIGAKPCGGPRRYLIYSHLFSDTARLKILTDRYTQLQEARNRLTQEISDCGLVLIPDTVVVEGRCRESFDKYIMQPQ